MDNTSKTIIIAFVFFTLMSMLWFPELWILLHGVYIRFCMNLAIRFVTFPFMLFF